MKKISLQPLHDRFICLPFLGAIRQALLYGSECWALKKEHIKKMGVPEMCMLRILRWGVGTP